MECREHGVVSSRDRVNRKLFSVGWRNQMVVIVESGNEFIGEYYCLWWTYKLSELVTRGRW